MGNKDKTIYLISYGDKYGTDVGSVKHLPNPYNKYPNKTGLDKEVQDYVLIPGTIRYINNIFNYITESPKLENVSIGIGCYGGKHRSVVVVEELKRRLLEIGYKVEVIHRDLNK
jgi:UPF0042 nucleotide-binding protein